MLFSFSASGRPGAPRGVGERGVTASVNGCVKRCPERVWCVFSNLQWNSYRSSASC